MYTFVCTGTPQHTSHSASKEQHDPSCPTCGAPTIEVRELDQHPLEKCGCEGEIKQGIGCLAYLDSDEHHQATQHENMMRAGGLGFGTQHSSSDAMMSSHLQANGLSYDEATNVLEKE